MRADHWASVWTYGVYFVQAFASRLHAYWPGEMARRRARDDQALDDLKRALLGDDEDTGDRDEVERWMDANGFAHTTYTRGIDEATEVQITEATEAFRARLAEVLGTDALAFHITIGVDKEDDDDDSR